MYTSENEINIEFEKYWNNEVINDNIFSDIKDLDKLKDFAAIIFENAYVKGIVNTTNFYGKTYE